MKKIFSRILSTLLTAGLVSSFALPTFAHESEEECDLTNDVLESTIADSIYVSEYVPNGLIGTMAASCYIQVPISGKYTETIYGTHNRHDSTTGEYSSWEMEKGINPYANGHSHRGTLTAITSMDYDARSGEWTCTKSNGDPCGGSMGLHTKKYTASAILYGTLPCVNP